MAQRAKSLWLNLSQSLGFVPGLMILLFAAAGIALVEVDETLELGDAAVVFQGDGDAARTVLSVIAGSLITVAGLTFSITMVVLQLASSQFSPRVLRTFFGDRITQITIGMFVGTFVFAILVLRRVGSFGDAGFVPRLSVTTASVLGLIAVVLLVVFLHHVSRMVQVSHVVAGITHESLVRTKALYPERHGEPVTGERGDELLERWRAEPPGELRPPRPGYVQRVILDDLGDRLSAVERLALLVAPGDFVSPDQPYAEVWPASAADGCAKTVHAAVTLTSERDLDQDVGFGLRQLSDIAARAMSPSINDPATAVTCVGYLRSIVVRLAERGDPPEVRRYDGSDLTVIVRRPAFGEYLEPLVQVGRYAKGDAWVVAELLRALDGAVRAAIRCGALERLPPLRGAAEEIADQTEGQLVTPAERERITRLLQEIRSRA